MGLFYSEALVLARAVPEWRQSSYEEMVRNGGLHYIGEIDGLKLVIRESGFFRTNHLYVMDQTDGAIIDRFSCGLGSRELRDLCERAIRGAQRRENVARLEEIERENKKRTEGIAKARELVKRLSEDHT